jgi:hypothetical protein
MFYRFILYVSFIFNVKTQDSRANVANCSMVVCMLIIYFDVHIYWHKPSQLMNMQHTQYNGQLWKQKSSTNYISVEHTLQITYVKHS